MDADEPAAYGQWFDHVFNRPDEENAWYFSYDVSFDADRDSAVELVSATFRHAGRDLMKYSDLQIKHGLSYIFYNFASDAIFVICQWKSVVLEVMEAALYLPNPACVESALHGLNHRFRQSENEVAAIIDRFLATAKHVRPELRRYASLAKSGWRNSSEAN